MDLAHRAWQVRERAMVPDGRYDVVLTTNSGYPQISTCTRPSGALGCMQMVKRGRYHRASECRGGIPDMVCRNLVVEGGSVEDPQAGGRPGFRRHDQWEAQLHAFVMQAADVFVYSDGLGDDQVREMLFTPVHDIEATVTRELARHGPGARLLVIPEGSQSIPYIAS